MGAFGRSVLRTRSGREDERKANGVPEGACDVRCAIRLRGLWTAGPIHSPDLDPIKTPIQPLSLLLSLYPDTSCRGHPEGARKSLRDPSIPRFSLSSECH